MASIGDSAPDAASNAELRRRFMVFLNAEEKTSKYAQRIDEMMAAKEIRLNVHLGDLRENNRDLANKILLTPIEHVPVFEQALKEAVLNKDPNYFTEMQAARHVGGRGDTEKLFKIHVGFDGSFGAQGVNPRSLSSEHISKLVSVEGIVTKCSSVRPKVVRSVHYCPVTGAFQSRDYRDAMDTSGLPTGSVYPTKDDQGNMLETEFGLSVYKDSQHFVIQEMPESAPLGQLPRSVDVYVENDLCDTVKPGDRVAVVGIYRATSGAGVSTTSGAFRTILIGTNVRRLTASLTRFKPTDDDITQIRLLSNNPDIFNIISRSLAPSIFGHKYIKQALTLLLLGGVEHTLKNGTHLRGDINVLMVGDPSTAKSQMLRFVLNIAPLAVNTTGRGSSGVGLTAAVTTDTETGERRLEAGAMVLADRGVVCIDEFDKMSDGDRVAIHEVMEQQTVTIAKAGIQASLNARCSVVAAANPIYGRFDNSLSIGRNVSLPDSLLSRFDLLFIVRDVIDPANDGRLAEHVLRMHRYVRPGMEGLPVPLDAGARDEERDEDKAGDDGSTPVFQKFNPLLHGGAAAEQAAEGGAAGEEARAGKVAVMTLEFVRKYIGYAKAVAERNKGPLLTDDARTAIVDNYERFRKLSKERGAQPITARSLETIIRLASAHAKLRLSRYVTVDDVDVVADIMEYAQYGDARDREAEGSRSVVTREERAAGRRKAREEARGGGGGGDGGDGGDDDDEDGGAGAGGKRRASPGAGSPSGKKKARTDAASDAGGGEGSGTPSSAARARRRGAASQSQSQEAAADFDDVLNDSGSGKSASAAAASTMPVGDGDEDDEGAGAFGYSSPARRSGRSGRAASASASLSQSQDDEDGEDGEGDGAAEDSEDEDAGFARKKNGGKKGGKKGGKAGAAPSSGGIPRGARRRQRSPDVEPDISAEDSEAFAYPDAAGGAAALPVVVDHFPDPEGDAELPSHDDDSVDAGLLSALVSKHAKEAAAVKKQLAKEFAGRTGTSLTFEALQLAVGDKQGVRVSRALLAAILRAMEQGGAGFMIIDGVVVQT